MTTTWTGQMITPATDHHSAPILRRAFDLETGHGPVTSAELCATALGLCEATLNGRPVADDLLTPGWTSYEWRLRYARWDVSTLLEQSNVLGILLGNGWHTGRLGHTGRRALYGDVRAGLAELRIRYADGHEQLIVTDERWESGPSDTTADDLYDGQNIDARRRDIAWTRPGPAPGGWTGVQLVKDFDRTRLVPYLAPPVRRQEQIAPQRVWRTASGALLLDFGQNLVGWLRLQARGPAGTVITVRHAEVLEYGELSVRPLRSAQATDRYTLSGTDDLFEPTLTFHGFRYADVTGWPATAEELAARIRAVVIGSDLRRTGTFECSDPLLNQLHANAVWSMRGNFVDVPTDCPQRDERLGWTGDLSAFVSTAVFLYDVQDFLRDWLADLAAEQVHADGMVPAIVPEVNKFLMRPEDLAGYAFVPHQVVALWNDAAVWVPWELWQAYGDRRVLEDQYESISSYVRRIGLALSERGLLESGHQFGDWLDPAAPADRPGGGRADRFVVATACVYRSVTMAVHIAEAVGRPEDAAEFSTLAARIRGAFTEHHVTAGRITSDAPAVYALAIVFGLLDADDERDAGQRLAELVAENGHRICTGFAGTPFILPALSRTGHLDTAYRLLLQQQAPSWLYPVTMGATTIWERWDAMRPDGTVNADQMTSFNHYAFGAVAEWLHQVVAGLSPITPGYRRFRVAPRPGGGLTSAAACLKTPHGEAAVRWQLHDDELTVDIQVPEDCAAVVDLPGQSLVEAATGHHRYHVAV